MKRSNKNFTQLTVSIPMLTLLTNISITNADDLNEFVWNWNNTNNSIYDDSLVLMMNFDNVSALGEAYNLTEGFTVVDVSNFGNA